MKIVNIEIDAAAAAASPVAVLRARIAATSAIEKRYLHVPAAK
jgi:hypothetical protein